MPLRRESTTVWLDFSYMYEGLSGMSVDTYNLYRIFNKQNYVIPLVWSGKYGASVFPPERIAKNFKEYLFNAGKIQKDAKIMIAVLKQLLFLCKNDPLFIELKEEDKQAVFNELWSKVLDSKDVDFNPPWYAIYPFAGIFYEAVKFSLPNILDKVCGIYQKDRHLPKLAKKDGSSIVFYQYPKFLRFRNALHVVKIHDLYPVYFKESIPPGSGARDTRIATLTKLSREIWPFYYVVPTESTKKDLVRFSDYFKDRTFVVPNNFQPSYKGELYSLRKVYRFFKMTNSRVRFRRYFIQVGTLQPIKNHWYTIKAFERLMPYSPDVGLVFVGHKGWGGKRLFEAVDRLQRKGRLVWVWGIKRRMLNSLIKYSEAMLMPSKAEGFGLPPLEALNMGVVPIVSDIPVFREVLKDCAVFVPLNNVGAYVTMLQRVLDNPAVFRGKINKCRRHLLKQYSDESILKQYNTLFNTLLKQSRVYEEKGKGKGNLQ